MLRLVKFEWMNAGSVTSTPGTTASAVEYDNSWFAIKEYPLHAGEGGILSTSSGFTHKDSG